MRMSVSQYKLLFKHHFIRSISALKIYRTLLTVSGFLLIVYKTGYASYAISDKLSKLFEFEWYNIAKSRLNGTHFDVDLPFLWW